MFLCSLLPLPRPPSSIPCSSSSSPSSSLFSSPSSSSSHSLSPSSSSPLYSMSFAILQSVADLMSAMLAASADFATTIPVLPHIVIFSVSSPPHPARSFRSPLFSIVAHLSPLPGIGTAPPSTALVFRHAFPSGGFPLLFISRIVLVASCIALWYSLFLPISSTTVAIFVSSLSIFMTCFSPLSFPDVAQYSLIFPAEANPSSSLKSSLSPRCPLLTLCTLPPIVALPLLPPAPSCVPLSFSTASHFVFHGHRSLCSVSHMISLDPLCSSDASFLIRFPICLLARSISFRSPSGQL